MHDVMSNCERIGIRINKYFFVTDKFFFLRMDRTVLLFFKSKLKRNTYISQLEFGWNALVRIAY